MSVTVTSEPTSASLAPDTRVMNDEMASVDYDGLIKAARQVHTKPLWAEMAKLNPPMPNPACVPHIWRYDDIRPALLRAGELVTEKQAERRVLMLVNPNRGPSLASPGTVTNLLTHTSCRRALHNRHTICRPTAGDASRHSRSSSPHRICHALHHRGPRRFHGCARPENPHEAWRRDPDAQVELA